jgi:hypothetical protein
LPLLRRRALGWRLLPRREVVRRQLAGLLGRIGHFCVPREPALRPRWTGDARGRNGSVGWLGGAGKAMAWAWAFAKLYADAGLGRSCSMAAGERAPGGSAADRPWNVLASRSSTDDDDEPGGGPLAMLCWRRRCVEKDAIELALERCGW